MRRTRFPWLLLFVAGLGCKSGSTVPEPGAVLLRVTCQEGAPPPDALRVWVYDDGGQLWDGVRFPAEGSLVPVSAQELGTILISPGAITGGLRVHVQGYLAEVRTHDGVLTIAALDVSDRIYDLQLALDVPRDTDHDGVPDLIDDCLGVANPLQGGCSSGLRDAAVGIDAGADSADDVPNEDVVGDLPRDVGVDGDWPADSVPDLIVGGDAPAVPMDVSSDVAGKRDLPTDIPIVRDTMRDTADIRPESVDGQVSFDSAPADAPDGNLDGGDGAVDGKTDVAMPDDTVEAPPDVAIPPDVPSCPDGGECDKPQGALCSDDAECASGACADGVCCTNSCTGACRSCNQPSANGVCQGYVSGSDPERECGSGETCNGAGACGPPPASLPNGQLCSFATQCASGFCKDGVCCDTACVEPCYSCGTGTCQTVKRTDDLPECTGLMTCNPQGKCIAK